MDPDQGCDAGKLGVAGPSPVQDSLSEVSCTVLLKEVSTSENIILYYTGWNWYCGKENPPEKPFLVGQKELS